MNTSRRRPAEDAILDGIDNYKMTLGSMCALAHVLEKHYGAESQIAPLMRPGPRGRDLVADPVTPDMLSQGQNVDLVVEIKRSLPNNEGGRAAFLRQIRKYDDDLAGWVRAPRSHDIMLMVHMSKSSQWADFLDDALKNKKITLDRKVSIVEYVRDSERNTYFILKMVWGETSNATLNKHLHKSIVVNAEEMVKKMSLVQFCDSRPHVAYTMSILWGTIFPALVTPDDHLSTRGRKALDFEVDLAEIMAKIRKSPESLFYPPRQSWITDALDMLVRLKMVERLTGGRFLVHYKSARSSLARLFARKLARLGVLRDQERDSDMRDYF